MTRGARIAIIAGIIIAVAVGAAVAAMSMSGEPQPPANDGNDNTADREPQEFVVELEENLSIDTTE